MKLEVRKNQEVDLTSFSKADIEELVENIWEACIDPARKETALQFLAAGLRFEELAAKLKVLSVLGLKEIGDAGTMQFEGVAFGKARVNAEYDWESVDRIALLESDVLVAKAEIKSIKVRLKEADAVIDGQECTKKTPLNPDRGYRLTRKLS